MFLLFRITITTVFAFWVIIFRYEFRIINIKLSLVLKLLVHPVLKLLVHTVFIHRMNTSSSSDMKHLSANSKEKYDYDNNKTTVS